VIPWPRIGQSRVERPRWEPMRVADQLLKCVAFVAEVIGEDTAGKDLDHQGTGFFEIATSE
jgi:hypothetical protein